MTASSFDKETDPMHSPVRSIRRFGQITCALVALALAALTVTPSAGASTLYACVNKRTGAARLYSYKPRCKRGQERLSWNTVGPAGKNGANGKNGAAGKNGSNGKNGTNGTNGTNGVVNGFSAGKPEYTGFTGAKPATILTKALNPGSYIVSAKTVISSTATGAVKAAAVCELLDGEPKALDSAGWDTGLVEEAASSFIGETTLSMDAAVTLKAAATVSLVCTDRSPDTAAQTIGASASQIVAVQTTQNG